ncbi:hypothetical protein GETHLI_17000 [Geothrix limicola]|uniref:DUF1501 domain-containing protein n=1 Tax=Geothrix limicola TaxID=2927978 RepID=A0ABQ5QFR2_9BACT|nr:DUF1501 domain-containing protein [Geothrix limicola]GLH73198.1 hypothetical protein GETHLI_17000 [Geothrix limicola]
MTTRREFIQTLGATGAALAGLTACSGGGKSSGGGGGSTQPPAPPPASPILVIVNIDGGYDWLNVMPPNAGSNLGVYQTKRATLGITDSGLLTDLGSGAALNKDFTGMDTLSALGRVAWIPGIGMPNPNLSHFTSIDLWGQGATVPAGTGWLGRFADTAFSPSGDVLRGLSVTSDLPVMLKGASRSFVSIPSAGGYVFPAYLLNGGTVPDAATLETGWGTALNATSPDPGYAAGAQAGKLFFDAQNNPAFGTGGALAARTPSVAYPGDTTYPITRLSGSPLTSSLSNQFKLIAQMIAAGLPGQVYFSRLGGWDTHSNQAVDHPNLQRALGGSIKAFYDDLATITTSAGNAQDRVMILAYSEFGRRVQENNGGTDHGTAGLAFCVGKAVKGGFYGAYPDLTNLDANGNMKFTTDFRSLYATVLDRWLGQATSTTDTLLGSAYPRLGFL